MAKTYYSVLTTYGSQLFANAMTNRQAVNITHFAVGDGNGRAVQPDSTRTSLVREVHKASISAVSRDPRNNRQVIFELTLPENVGGFWIREMGIFDNTGRLVAIANCPDTYKPRLDEGSGKIQVLRMILLVSSSDAVTLKVDDTVIFVTRGQFTPKTITANSINGFDDTGHSHAIDTATTSRKGITQLTNDTGLDSEVLALTAKAGKAIAQSVAQLQVNTNNALNQKVNKTDISNAVNSTSQTTVASSQAVKTAYDKGIEAKSAADAAQRTANAKYTAVNASITQKGLVQLTNDTGLDSEVLALTAKAGKAITQSVAQLQVNTNNALNQKVNKTDISNSVTSTSQTTVASSQAAKTAYDKGVEAKSAADAAQRTADAKYTAVNASITQKGLVQLTNDTGLDSDVLALTAKAGKAIAQSVAQLQLSTTNALNQKVNKTDISNSVTSTSQTTVASSQAAKTAYDKGVEAKNAADAAQRTANAKQSPATTLAGYGITDFVVKREPNTANARNLLVDGIYAFGDSGVNLPKNGAFKVLNLGGGSAEWRHQLAIGAYSSEIYLSSQVSESSAEWLPWKRIDGADWNEVRNKPTTVSGLGITDFDNRVTALFTYQKIGDIEVRKYPDGTMIQAFTKRMTSSDYSTATVLWAQAFISRPILTGTARYEASVGDHDSIVTFVKGTDHAKCVFVKGETYNNHNELAYVDVIAIGRWK
ncbi:phage tail protein [Glaesserella parasuis]|nr:phage tail fiber repeat family protein [Glaesserella parasuis SW114]MDD2171693.1 phage tail protein [Glaesserella parasuis]MDP0272095.1 phage tail protein [Glaesserella parasuis]MDP0306418.1 phage tail protein [Glaesserella parasuis]MDP0471122.1 phage tail protein [Glaesserella parasuis]